MLVDWETAIEDLVGSVYTAINLRKTLTEFVNNAFTLERTAIPHKDLEDLVNNHGDGIVYVVPGTPGDVGNIGRKPSGGLREFSVQVGFQVAPVEPQDWTAVVQHLQFIAQLEAAAMFDPDGFEWLRLEYLKDENDVPFTFMGLRNANIFEAYFTAFYQRGVRPPN